VRALLVLHIECENRYCAEVGICYCIYKLKLFSLASTFTASGKSESFIKLFALEHEKAVSTRGLNMLNP